MELAEKTVYDILEEESKKEKHLSEKDVLRILKETCEGVKEMHDCGILHQDIKVENILIDQKGKAKLCDFGSSTTQKIKLDEVPKSKLYQY